MLDLDSFIFASWELAHHWLYLDLIPGNGIIPRFEVLQRVHGYTNLFNVVQSATYGRSSVEIVES